MQDKLQEKLDRVSLMEERRSVLMEHLCALKRDISDLDVGIRVPPPPATATEARLLCSSGSCTHATWGIDGLKV